MGYLSDAYRDLKWLEKMRKEADGCEGCTYQDREPWETPCLICKRNAMDLYERWEWER